MKFAGLQVPTLGEGENRDVLTALDVGVGDGDQSGNHCVGL